MTRPRRSSGTGQGEAIYRRIVRDLQQQIESGQLPPGAALPSQNQLNGLYGVSSTTARHAIEELRRLGLVTVTRGRLTRVRAQPETGVAVDIDVRHRRHDYVTWENDPAWSMAAAPAAFQGVAGSFAAQLALPDPNEPVIMGERVLRHESGTRVGHWYVMPLSELSVSLETALNEASSGLPGRIYRHFSDSGQVITWCDMFTAEMPTLTDFDTLGMRAATPLLVHTRVTLGTGGKPLLVERTRHQGTAGSTRH